MADARIVVVIGGTSGIGRAIALRFAEDGWRTVVAGRDQARGSAVAEACMASAGSPAARFVETDVTNPASVEALAGATMEAFDFAASRD